MPTSLPPFGSFSSYGEWKITCRYSTFTYVDIRACTIFVTVFGFWTTKRRQNAYKKIPVVKIVYPCASRVNTLSIFSSADLQVNWAFSIPLHLLYVNNSHILLVKRQCLDPFHVGGDVCIVFCPHLFTRLHCYVVYIFTPFF